MTHRATTRADLAGDAYREALRLRVKAGRPNNMPVCPFDVAEQIGVEVRFVDIPSLEAMYVDDGEPKILISADRPTGRQRFSCAHELGHHAYGHGTHFSCHDLSPQQRRSMSDDEYIAQAFAGYLLLPKAAVSHAFAVRGWDARAAIAEEYYRVASSLGVSFEALVTHCEIGLRLLNRSDADRLHSMKLPNLRQFIAGQAISGHLAVVDSFSVEAATDLRVGDFVLAPTGSSAIDDAITVQAPTTSGALFQARRPGISGVQLPSETGLCAVRIARAGYVGRAIFRHLEDPDYA
jgi:Zn-dependent peptidase ImmA (M78 family)